MSKNANVIASPERLVKRIRIDTFGFIGKNHLTPASTGFKTNGLGSENTTLFIFHLVLYNLINAYVKLQKKN